MHGKDPVLVQADMRGRCWMEVRGGGWARRWERVPTRHTGDWKWVHS